MFSLFGVNGLTFWTEREIRIREQLKRNFAIGVEEVLLGTNTAWKFVEVETPLLTPRNLLNPNYTGDDIWVQESGKSESTELALRPETTPGSYVYAQHLLEHQMQKPPFCVWTAGKSFRREQDQVSKNMRLKEFYQQEFQCIYTADSFNDYHTAVLEPVRRIIQNEIGLATRIIPSDRLPSYSQITSDVEVYNGDKWMEVCSISRRTDFPSKFRYQAKTEIKEKDLVVVEIAIGLDRCVYNRIKREEMVEDGDLITFTTLDE
jgi:glycyl-tRNA synthetase